MGNGFAYVVSRRCLGLTRLAAAIESHNCGIDKSKAARAGFWQIIASYLWVGSKFLSPQTKGIVGFNFCALFVGSQ